MLLVFGPAETLRRSLPGFPVKDITGRAVGVRAHPRVIRGSKARCFPIGFYSGPSGRRRWVARACAKA